MTANSTVGIYDIAIEQGATFTITIRMLDSSNNNLFTTATSAAAQLREMPQSTTKLADFDCEFAANNISLTCTLDANTTAALSKRTMHWDVKVFYPTHEDFILRGKAYLNYTVTR